MKYRRVYLLTEEQKSESAIHKDGYFNLKGGQVFYIKNTFLFKMYNTILCRSVYFWCMDIWHFSLCIILIIYYFFLGYVLWHLIIWNSVTLYKKVSELDTFLIS